MKLEGKFSKGKKWDGDKSENRWTCKQDNKFPAIMELIWKTLLVEMQEKLDSDRRDEKILIHKSSIFHSNSNDFSKIFHSILNFPSSQISICFVRNLTISQSLLLCYSVPSDSDYFDDINTIRNWSENSSSSCFFLSSSLPDIHFPWYVR